jgi:hypothetical protein
LPTALAYPLPVAFTTAPPPASGAWAALAWQKLAPDDPFGAVRIELTSGQTSLAVGDLQETTSSTVWASTDQTHWQPTDSGALTTLPSGLTVIGLATLTGRFVAVTELNDYLYRYLPPVMSWTLTDGRNWTHAATLPADVITGPAGSPLLVATGPAGLVVATTGLAARSATSSDGSNWVVSPRNALPAAFSLADLRGTPSGYVAIGAWTKGGSTRAAALTSADGRHWPTTPTLLPTATSGPSKPAASNALTVMVGDHGMIAAGIGGSPGGALWWRSVDGRHWQALPTFTPLGATTCGGANCGLQPNGTLIGDGHRLVAVRGGADAVALVSTDGLSWTALDLSGNIPGARATQAVLLPGGVLLSDGTTTWFGQAVSR